MGIHDPVHRIVVGVSVKSPRPARQPDPVDRPDQTSEIIVGVLLGIVLVGPQPVGVTIGSRNEILTPGVIAI